MINNGLTLRKHFHRSKEVEKNACSPLLFSMASLKNKKYSYRKETPSLLFAGAITVALKNNPRVLEKY